MKRSSVVISQLPAAAIVLLFCCPTLLSTPPEKVDPNGYQYVVIPDVDSDERGIGVALRDTSRTVGLGVFYSQEFVPISDLASTCYFAWTWVSNPLGRVPTRSVTRCSIERNNPRSSCHRNCLVECPENGKKKCREGLEEDWL